MKTSLILINFKFNFLKKLALWFSSDHNNYPGKASVCY